MGFGKDGKGVIITELRALNLGALDDGDAKIISTKLAIADDFRMLKSQVSALATAIATGEAVGLMFGLADGDLSAVEVAAAVQAQGPLDSNDSVTADVAMRPVWLLGAIDTNERTNRAFFRGAEDSTLLVAKPRWTFGTTKSWNWFVFNHSGATLTTGLTVRVIAKNFGVWIR